MTNSIVKYEELNLQLDLIFEYLQFNREYIKYLELQEKEEYLKERREREVEIDLIT